jgi:hypothetical protein
MVNNSGRSTDTRRIRRLKSPIAAEVETGAGDVPLRLRLNGHWQDVSLMRQPWRIDQHWWREEAHSRTYYRVILGDGLPLTIYRDLDHGGWFRQEYR